MNLINKGDFLESYTKLKQKGIKFFFQKINTDAKKRTQSTFNLAGLSGSNWWNIPEVKHRENEKISGNPGKTFDIHLAENYFRSRNDLNLLSIGCGVGNREIRIAGSGHFKEVIGIDLSGESVFEANKKVKEKGLTNIKFEKADFYQFEMGEEQYDVILFYSSLHHFKNMEEVALRVAKALKNDGFLILSEYVGMNRLQFSKEKINEMNRLLGLIPDKYRRQYLTNRLKKKIYPPGLLRMIISDPSEAVESKTILPVIHRNFKIVEEKKTGGDLLMMVLKDIAHNFINDDPESEEILKKLFDEEDAYLENVREPDFIFGVYQKK